MAREIEWLYLAMATLSALVARLGKAARWRVGLLALVVVLAGGNSAWGTASAFADARVYVDAHNAVRAAVQKPADYAKPWTPVPPVAWSDEVASSAQAWADQLRDANKCNLMHSDTRYGENLAGGKDMDAAGAVKLWETERTKYRYAPVYDFVITTGHYTQIVWRKTTHIGCGRATCGKKAVVVCRYSPAGNRIGSSPY